MDVLRGWQKVTLSEVSIWRQSSAELSYFGLDEDETLLHVNWLVDMYWGVANPFRPPESAVS